MNTHIPRHAMRLLFTALLCAGVMATSASAQDAKPTIVLVHGAFAESASWNGVLSRLIAKGYPVVAVANPLRGVKNDAVYVSSVIDSTPGPVVLVGHSYGGLVITNAVAAKENVKALVFVAAFAPDTGETASELSSRFPGSTLGPTLAAPVAVPDGGKDLYIRQDRFRAQFAADVPVNDARLMAATLRPITEAALNETSATATWKTIPSWFIYGDRDLNIPPAAQAFMAKRAGSKETIVVAGASHVVMVSHPDAVAAIIERAAASK